MEENIRLQVALAQLGAASRRGAAEIIKAGRVRINGKTILEPGCRVNLGKDAITIDGKSSYIQEKAYILLNKPKDVVTTVKDKYAECSVLDLIKQKDVRIYPVGRLDKDTTGLLLLTNDGDLAYRLTHPKFELKKVYYVQIKGQIDRKILQKLEKGIVLEGKKTYPCKVKFINYKNQITNLEVVLTEGRKRQIKKMFFVVGNCVVSINRIAFASLKLGSLKRGSYRELKASEVMKLKKVAGSCK